MQKSAEFCLFYNTFDTIKLTFMKLTKSGKKLEQVIKKAMEDLKITQAEYDEIINIANADGRIDDHERVLLEEFNKLIEQNMVKRVK
jgi:hypothetical protein